MSAIAPFFAEPVDDKVPVELGPVQETLLIPLLGRALESQKPDGLLNDPKAVEIVDQLAYDFDKWRGGPSLQGACIRTLMFDDFVRRFLNRYPSGTVVELGCGLNTRFDRVDNGLCKWFDLDLPDVMALRRRYFSPSPRCRMITASVTDTDWLATVHATGGPWLFLSEAVLIYLDEADVRQALTNIVTTFPACRIVLDTTDSAMVDSQGTHDAMRHLPRASWFRWKCDDPRSIQDWLPHVALSESLTFLDMAPELARHLPLRMRLVMRLMPWLLRRKIGGYRMNLLGPTAA